MTNHWSWYWHQASSLKQNCVLMTMSGLKYIERLREKQRKEAEQMLESLWIVMSIYLKLNKVQFKIIFIRQIEKFVRCGKSSQDRFNKVLEACSQPTAGEMYHWSCCNRNESVETVSKQQKHVCNKYYSNCWQHEILWTYWLETLEVSFLTWGLFTFIRRQKTN